MTARIDSVRIEQLDANDPIVLEAARQPGGVRVVDALGVLRFTLSIPSEPLPIEHCPGCQCRDDRVDAIVGSAELQDVARQYKTAGERILYVLSRYPDVAFAPAQLIRATQAAEDAIRMALKRLSRNGQIRHLGYARWQALEVT